MHRLTSYSAVTLLGLLSFTSITAAEDWPTWRHDAGRTNISAEKIPAPLRLQWKRQLPPVKPAFRKSRLQFDQGYEPIVLGNTMYLALPHIQGLSDVFLQLDDDFFVTRPLSRAFFFYRERGGPLRPGLRRGWHEVNAVVYGRARSDLGQQVALMKEHLFSPQERGYFYSGSRGNRYKGFPPGLHVPRVWNRTRILILCRGGSPFSGACNETMRHRFRTAADLDLTSVPVFLSCY